MESPERVELEGFLPDHGRKRLSRKEVEAIPPDFGDKPLLDLVELETIWAPAEAQHARALAYGVTVRLFAFIGDVLSPLAEGRCDFADPILPVAIQGDLGTVSGRGIHLRFVTVAQVVPRRRDPE